MSSDYRRRGDLRKHQEVRLQIQPQQGHGGGPGDLQSKYCGSRCEPLELYAFPSYLMNDKGLFKFPLKYGTFRD